jgi:hypothetical protein
VAVVVVHLAHQYKTARQVVQAVALAQMVLQVAQVMLEVIHQLKVLPVAVRAVQPQVLAAAVPLRLVELQQH